MHTGGQRELRYDVLVVAVGARTGEALPGVVPIDVARMDESLHGLMEETDSALFRTLAFVAPRSTWPLPVYEATLLVQRRAREHNVDLGVTIITAGQPPLDGVLPVTGYSEVTGVERGYEAGMPLTLREVRRDLRTAGR